MLDLERFWAKVDKTPECWNWIGSLSEGGYGRVKIGPAYSAPQSAHRISYYLLRGDIPRGMCIDHLCRNRACVNPAHLEAVTYKENILRGTGATARNAKKTHCVRGHEFSPENIFHIRGMHRRCRECMRQDSAKKYAKRSKSS